MEAFGGQGLRPPWMSWVKPSSVGLHMNKNIFCVFILYDYKKSKNVHYLSNRQLFCVAFQDLNTEFL